MCGRINVIDSPAVQGLCENLEIELWPVPLHTGRFKRATDAISIVHTRDNVRVLDSAIWWLLLEPADTGFKPSKYTSFNTRYDKLNVPRSAGFHAFKHSRCVIPVSGFGESEYQNGKPLHYHDLFAKSGAMLLGGLCRYWLNKHTGEQALSCSVITLPPHPKLSAIHSKASPLMLPMDKTLIDDWLNPDFTDTAQFQTLLSPHIPIELNVQQIDKPSRYQAIGTPFSIDADPPTSWKNH